MVSTSTLQQPRLHNRYSIQQTLGARLGRRTLLGYDHSRNCQVVIKYLCFDDPLQPSDTKRFHEEITVLKILDHPAIPTYLDSFEINEHGYVGLMLVQAYIDGQSLYAVINEQKTLAEPEIRDLARQILDILDYLHNQRPTIIHRDIKPSSLVLSQTSNTTPGKVYLVDFGLVQRAGTTEGIGEEPILISGTPGYRPPEQLGDRAVPATDLYSLGATLVHLATGQHPNQLPQRGLRILFGQELGHMSRSLKAWLRWLTQPKQHKRPLSAQAAIQGLAQADKIFVPSHNHLSLGNLSQRFQRAFLETMAPADTQLKIFEYSQTLEVVLPPQGWKTKPFCLAFLQTMTGVVGTWLIFQSFRYFWPQLIGFWQHLLAIVVSWGWTHLSLRFGYQGFKRTLTTLFQQVSIQLLPDIILLGYRVPCRPVDYQINTYKQDIEDIDLQPGGSTITFHLRNNRTVMGKLEYVLPALDLGLTPSEISWINNILQLWLKHKAPSV
ncbi:serine/threonine protein kinase [Leptothoe spongobia]|uniref:Serine/threonine protein kinase n=1 Tax=Leptothoe spongobia TAU-MAC 1115 TaxID=1967444 RepID=A0A947GI35_9CYAN|nr:serine/threonine-protein kinase [Leptothoe spongobia]MBT9315399.1 serine/threonine protein kinase [Leptothoe spongobia TAU-MAC 1115]